MPAAPAAKSRRTTARRNNWGPVENPDTVYRSVNAAHINPWSRRRLLLHALQRQLSYCSQSTFAPLSRSNA
ncbi:hypothetical protein PDR5_39110 [Pseudomonas sp. DR 5-09]|nr:hypothetical protein PDR5_39110 [Pseudomonas sp. DR 5-09]